MWADDLPAIMTLAFWIVLTNITSIAAILIHSKGTLATAGPAAGAEDEAPRVRALPTDYKKLLITLLTLVLVRVVVRLQVELLVVELVVVPLLAELWVIVLAAATALALAAKQM